MKLEIEVKDSKVRKLLKKLQSRVTDMSPIMENVAALMRRAVDKNFEVEGRDKAGHEHTWKELAPSTQRYRARHKGEKYAAHPILEFNGDLKKSLNVDHGKDWAKVYTGVKYGVYHQLGTKKMPARPFLLIPRTDLKAIVAYLKEKLWGDLK